MRSEVLPVPARCVGASLLPGDPPPLTKSVPIVAIYQNGAPIRADGCPYNTDNKCLAIKRLPADAPNCLFINPPGALPMIPEEKQDNPPGIGGTVALRTMTADDIIGETAVSTEGIVLRPSAAELDLDIEALGRETADREMLQGAQRAVMGIFTKALLAMTTPPTYKERLEKTRKQQRGFIARRIDAYKDQSGTVETSQRKRLPSGITEDVNFVHNYNKVGKLDRIYVTFPGTSLNIDFAEDNISALSLKFGEGRTTETGAENVLQNHDMQDSILGKFIRSVPATLPGGIELNGRTDINISFTEPSVSITNYIGPRSYDSSSYGKTLHYSPQFNKFIEKSDTKGVDGLSIAEALYLSRDILKLLPFVVDTIYTPEN